MKATGIVRKIDELGRITLPIELRRTYGIEVGTPVEIYATGEGIVIRPYQEPNSKLREQLQLELEAAVGIERAKALMVKIAAISNHARNDETPGAATPRESDV